MKPAKFAYRAPETVEEAVELLRENGDEALLLAGGQSLVPMMNLRIAAPRMLIDINRIAGLDQISVNGEVSIGAVARQSTLERSPEVRRATPIIHDALRQVGHVAIRSRGTIGGSIAHADPAAELPAVLLALDGAVVVTGPAGDRTIGARNLFLSVFTTALEIGEMITNVRFPISAGGWSVQEVARRHGDFAIAGAVAQVVSNVGGITEARLALFGVAAVPVRIEAIERQLVGRRTDDTQAFADAAQEFAEAIDALDDVQLPASYRRRVAAAVARRALAEAAERSAL